MNKYQIQGLVKTRRQSTRLPPLRVEAWGTRNRQAILLGSTQTDAGGRFITHHRVSLSRQVW